MKPSSAICLILCFIATMADAISQSNPSYLEQPVYTPGAFPELAGGIIGVADFNLDGRDDVACAYGPYWVLHMTSMNGAVGPAVWTTYSPPGCLQYCTLGNNLLGPLIGDFNRDGKQDLLFLNYGSPTDPASPVYLGDGLGQFNYQTSLCLHGQPTHWVPPIDLDLDGYPEIVLFSSSYPTLLSFLEVVSTVGGQYSQAMLYPSGRKLASPKFADVTGDGIPDLVSLAAYASQSSVSHIFVRQGIGSASAFGQSWSIPLPTAATTLSGNGYLELVAADLDGVGGLDLVLNATQLSTESATISTCLNPFSGASWWTMSSPGMATNGGLPLQAVDMNRDGMIDLVGGQNYGIAWGTPTVQKRLSVALGLGMGQFQTPVFIQVPPTPAYALLRATSVGDFDGDGDPDVVFAQEAPLGPSIGLARNRSLFGAPTGGGYWPLITASGAPTIGNSQFAISVTGMPVSAPAVLALSLATSPVASAVLVDLSPPYLLLPSGQWGITYTSAQGAATVQIPLPPSPALQGAVVYGQWGAIHPTSGSLAVLSGGATFIIM